MRHRLPPPKKKADAQSIAIGDETVQRAIDSNWGEFQLRRDPIKGGVRYSMSDCPNALAWTITTG